MRSENLLAKLIFLCLFVIGPVLSAADPKEIAEIVNQLLASHYVYGNVDTFMAEQIADNIIGLLDPAKTALLQTEVANFKNEFPQHFTSLLRGDLTKILELSSLITKRQEENLAFARKLLGPDYQIDQDAIYIFDPKKRDYASTEAQRLASLTKQIHYQMANLQVAGKSLVEAREILANRYRLAAKQRANRRIQDEADVFLQGFASALDPHTEYFPAHEGQNFQLFVNKQLEGVGMAIHSEDGIPEIESLVDGGSAKRSGLLKPHDKILSVSQGSNAPPVSVIDLPVDDAISLIRGKAGTKVKLKILRPSEGNRTFEVELLREKIRIEDNIASLSYEERKAGNHDVKLGIIKLPSFYGGSDGAGCFTDVSRLIKQAKANHVDGLVLDLSGNGGGYMEQAVLLAGLFVESGPVVATHNVFGETRVKKSPFTKPQYDGPLVVLVDRYSASAAEILAGYLKFHRRSVTVGAKQTVGKGSVQNLVDASNDGGMFKVTTDLYFLPDGRSPQHSGIEVDVLLPDALDYVPFGERHFENTIPPHTIASFGTSFAAMSQSERSWDPIRDGNLYQLANRSRVRVATSHAFARIKETAQKFREANGSVRVGDVLLGKTNDAPSAVEGGEPRLRPNLDEALNVLTDVIDLSRGGHRAAYLCYDNFVWLRNTVKVNWQPIF